MTARYRNTHIAPSVLALCADGARTMAELQAQFDAAEQPLVRHHVYNLVKRGWLRNLTEGKCGNGKVGRFVVTELGQQQPSKAAEGPKRWRNDGMDLQRAWGVAC